jgi:hypothetical protein
MLGGMLSERPRIYAVIVFTVQNFIVAVCIDWCVIQWREEDPGKTPFVASVTRSTHTNCCGV